MERAELEVKSRAIGKGVARRLRGAGEIPAVLYGKGAEARPLSVGTKAIEQAVHSVAGMNVLLDLAIDGKEKVVARIRDYQADPIRRHFTHLDFQLVDLTRKIVVEVPIHFEGKAEGVKAGGILEINRRSIEVRCLPTAIPEFIAIDISALNIGDGIHVNDMKLPEGVECPPHVNYSVVSVVAPQKEEEVAPAVAPGEVAATAQTVEAAPAAAPAGEAAAPAKGKSGG